MNGCPTDQMNGTARPPYTSGRQRFPDLPEKMRALPVDHRGFPVPWFVPFVEGKPVFPAQEGGKFERAWRNELCWVCGGKLGRFATFVIGPMCGVNRTTSEPPCHLECAQFSARNCPFLANPRMRRTIPFEKAEAEGQGRVAGCGIARNPGVTLLWTVKLAERGKLFRAGHGQLIEIGRPVAREWYREGREATRDEVIASIKTGLPLLIEMVEKESTDARRAAAWVELGKRVGEVSNLLPLRSSPVVTSCGTCEKRGDDSSILGCTRLECPMFSAEAWP